MKESNEEKQAPTDRPGPSGRKALQDLLWMCEAERQSVSHDLHDEIGGSLTAVKLELALLRKACDENAERVLERISGMLSDAMDLTGALSHDLRSDILLGEGLAPAVSAYLERYTARTGMAVAFRPELDDEGLSQSTRLAAYRIVRSSLACLKGKDLFDQAEIKLVRVDDAISLTIEAIGKDSGECSFETLEGIKALAFLAGGKLTFETPTQNSILVSCTLPAS